MHREDPVSIGYIDVHWAFLGFGDMHWMDDPSDCLSLTVRPKQLKIPTEGVLLLACRL